MASESRLLHLGLGAFNRANQASYLQDLRDRGDCRWQLAGGNLRGDQLAVESALRMQRGSYTLETVSPDGQRRYRCIDALRELLPWQDGARALVELGARADTRIVSLTVTEAGYGLDGAGRLDEGDPGVAADVAMHARGGGANTVYGLLASLLARRRSEGGGALTLLSCDNLRHNGTRLHRALLRFLELAGDMSLRDWTQDHASCPNAMVDRITPRPDAGVRTRVLAATGREDGAAVMAEEFRQWVIEEDFRNGRPDWEQVGVQMVDSVAPFEEAKIRLLNASHSAIAWSGLLTGSEFIHEGARDARIQALVRDYTDEAIACLRPSPLDLGGYRDTVLARFGNAALADTHQRVVADSAAKLREFVLPTLCERLAAGARIEGAAMLPALFLAFLHRWSANELPFAHADQAMDEATAHGICADADPARALVGERTVFGELAGSEELLAAVRRAGERVAAHARGILAA
jgi:D-arabinitol 4-dehydrogenase